MESMRQELGQPYKRNNSPYNYGDAFKEYLGFILTEAKVGAQRNLKINGEDSSERTLRMATILVN